MIPKIIHYTWFSGEPFPEKIQNCINSWKDNLPDYELKLWDIEAIKDFESIYLKEALSQKKWAYAADYVRLYVIYREGGIYLDTDALVYKSFDSLLQHEAFIGKESSIHFEGGFSSQYLTSHCFGAIKNHPFIKRCLDYYENRNFITSDHIDLPYPLKYNMVLLPYIQAEIARQYGYDWKPKVQNIQKCKSGLIVFPSDAFDPQIKVEGSFCKHLALGEWRVDKPLEPIYNLKYKIEWRIISLLRRIIYNFGYVIMKVE